jgi:aldehyde dehydrogenase (NAD+)
MTKFEYAPAPESASIVEIKSEYGLYINGKFQAAKANKSFETINPATGKPLARVAFASHADVDKAVNSATEAYKKIWSKMPASER